MRALGFMPCRYSTPRAHCSSQLMACAAVYLGWGPDPCNTESERYPLLKIHRCGGGGRDRGKKGRGGGGRERETERKRAREGRERKRGEREESKTKREREREGGG